MPKTVASYIERSSSDVNGAHGRSAAGMLALAPIGLVDRTSVCSSAVAFATRAAHAPPPPMGGYASAAPTTSAYCVKSYSAKTRGRGGGDLSFIPRERERAGPVYTSAKTGAELPTAPATSAGYRSRSHVARLPG